MASSTRSRCASSPAGRSTTALVRLEDAALIERVSEVRLGRYRFRHGLLRDATYETQLLPLRQETHRSIAELLGSGATAPGDLAVVAQHWDLAGDVAQSIPAYISAAQAAQSAASHTEARQLLDRALELASTMPEGDERDLTELMIRMQRAISTSSQFGYGYPEVFEDFRIAEEICRKLTNRPEIMPAQVGIWSYLLVRGSVDAANVVLEPLADVLDDPATAWFAPEIKSCMGYGAFYQGRLDEAHRWLLEAWEGYRARSIEAASSPFWPLPHDAVPITAVALACVAALQGATEESALWERRAIATAEELDFPSGPFSAAFVSVYLAWIRMIMGNRDGGPRVRAAHDGDRGAVPLRLLPAARDAVRAAARADRPCDADGARAVRHWGWTSSATVRSARPTSASSPRTTTSSATPTRPSARSSEALERTTTSGELVHQPDLLRLRAEILTAAYPDRMDEAVDDLVDAIEIGLAQGSLVLALRAANDLARLPHDSAPDWSDRLRSVLERFPPNSSSPELAEALDLLGV